MPPRNKASGTASSSSSPSTPAPARKWTHDDDDALTAALEHGDGQLSWAEIASMAFPDGKFTKTDCNSRWTSLSRPKTIKGSWTAAEDAKLVELVDEFGSEKWVIISSQMGSRSGKQCRERWHNHLNPNIKKSDWSPEEDALIRDLHAKIGPRWAEMAKHLPGRPDNSIKNYWNARQAREKRDRSKSMSQASMAAGADKVKAAKARAAAAASAALEAAASRQPVTPAPAMSRSSSSASLNNARFTPYARSSPMSKSRSESVSSLGAFSSVRSSTSIETLASSPSSQISAFTQTHPGRSQSMVGIAGSAAPHARRISQHVFPQEQLGALAAATVNGDDSKVLAAPRPPFFPSHGTSRSIGTPDRFRRPHANSSPPAPSGLYTYASPPAELPTPPPQFVQTVQQQQHVDSTGPWGGNVVAQGSGLELSDNGQPALSRLYTDSDFSHDSSAASPYDDYSSAPSSAFYSAPGPDSRFASPTDDADPMQHAFFGAGPLSFDPSAQHVAFETGQAGVAGPYIHPAHLTTLDETFAYSASQDSTPLVGSSSGGFDPYSMFDSSQGVDDGSCTPGSAPSSVAASPHESTMGVTVDTVTGLVYSAGPSTAGSHSEVHPSFGAFGSAAAGGGGDGGPETAYLGSSATSAGLSQQSSFAPADDGVYAFDPSLGSAPTPMEGTAARPSLARQHTAPAAFAFPPPRQPLVAAPMRRPMPLQLPSSSSSSSLGSRSSHSHRHTPSLPNAATPTHLSFGPDQTTPIAASLKGSLPPSASFPGRQAGHGHSLSSSLSGSLSGSLSASSLLSGSTASSSSRTVHGHGGGSQHAHTRHRSLSRATPYGGVGALRASTGSGAGGALAAPFDMAAASSTAAAPALSRSGSRAGLASEPMSKVYSSPLSEIAGRWEGLSLTSPSSGGGAAPWLARSGSMGEQGGLAALIAEEARAAAGGGGGGGGGAAPPVSLAHPTTGLMRVDENGRASLPL